MTTTDAPTRKRAAGSQAAEADNAIAVEHQDALREAEELEAAAAAARAKAHELAGTVEADPFGNEAQVVAWSKSIDFRHRRKCPIEAGASTRMEVHPDRTPGDQEKGIQPRNVLVVRCIECGESDVTGRDGKRLDDDD